MTITEHRPRGLLRWVLRFPIWLYRFRLGWLLGERFLLLTHIGRKSGLPHQTVIEVLRHDIATDSYTVAAAWGEKADWFRNILHNPNVAITVGCRNLTGYAERLAPEVGGRELLDYARQHPRAFREITRFVTGRPVDGTPENCRRLADSVPIVVFRPRSTRV